MKQFLKKAYPSLFLFSLFSCSFVTAEQSQVVHLTPPSLTPETIAQEIVCTRPMREGKFNISTDTYLAKNGQTKLIVNCNGHGGSGWTTLFGSIDKAISLFQQTSPNREVPVRIIGSGCIGLTMAIELSRLGYQVAGITTKDRYDNPSWRAAGYFAFVSVKTSPEEQDNLNEIGMKTFLTYQQIEKGEHPYLSAYSVRFMPVYCSEGTEAGVEELEAKGLIPPKESVTLDFGNGVQHPGYIKYMTYFMNTTTLMQELTDEVKRLGIPIVLQQVQSYDDVEESVIFTCAGLGSRELNQDANLIPVRGHLVALNEKSGIEHMDYMIYTKVEQEGQDEYIYMFPKDVSITPATLDGLKCRSVLGGTFLPYVDRLSPEEQQALDKKEFKKLLDRNSLFFWGHPFFD